MIVSRHLLQKSDRTLRRFQTPKPGSWKIWEGCLWKPVWRKFSECYRTPTCLNGRFPAPLCTMASKHPNSSSFWDHDFQPGLWWVALNRAEGPWLCWTKKKSKIVWMIRTTEMGGSVAHVVPQLLVLAPTQLRRRGGREYVCTALQPTTRRLRGIQRRALLPGAEGTSRQRLPISQTLISNRLLPLALQICCASDNWKTLIRNRGCQGWCWRFFTIWLKTTLLCKTCKTCWSWTEVRWPCR